MEEEEKGGISIGEIFRAIWSQKVVALIVLLVITILGTAILKFGYSSITEEYVSKFTVNISTSSSGIFYYPDGTRRNYLDLVSLDNLNDVKDSNSEYANINVEKMYEKGDIRITMVVDTVESDDTNISYSVLTFELGAKSKYFESSKTATKFISDIIKTPYREIKSWLNKLIDNMTIGYNEKLGNDLKLSYVTDQLYSAQSRISSLEGYNGTALLTLSNMLLTARTMSGELLQNHYESSVEALKNYVYLITVLERELETTTVVLDDLLKAENNQDVAASIVSYSTQKKNLEDQIKEYRTYLRLAGCEVSGDDENGYIYNFPEQDNFVGNDPVGSAAFIQKLDKLFSDLKQLVIDEEFTYYDEFPFISYVGSPVKAEGGMSLLISGAISFIVGLIIACIVAFIVSKVKESKATATVANATQTTEIEVSKEITDEENKQD